MDILRGGSRLRRATQEGAGLSGHGTGGSRFVGSGPVGSIKILKKTYPLLGSNGINGDLMGFNGF